MKARMALTLAVSALSLLGGCARPSEVSRQNRRLMDGLLTAVTTKNVQELDKCMEMLDKRRADALLSARHHQRLGTIYAVAKSGNWAEAEELLYKFRQDHPFPK